MMKLNECLELENFGPISKAKLQISPFTIIIGKNNTGKSFCSLAYHTLNQGFKDTVRELLDLAEEGRFYVELENHTADMLLFDLILKMEKERKYYEDILTRTSVLKEYLEETYNKKKTIKIEIVANKLLEKIKSETSRDFTKRLLEKQFKEKFASNFNVSLPDLVKWGKDSENETTKEGVASLSLEKHYFKIETKITKKLSMHRVLGTVKIKEETCLKLISEILETELSITQKRSSIISKLRRILDTQTSKQIEGILEDIRFRLTEELSVLVLKKFIEKISCDMNWYFIPAGRGTYLKTYELIMRAYFKAGNSKSTNSVPGLMKPEEEFITTISEAKDQKTFKSLPSDNKGISDLLNKMDQKVLKGTIETSEEIREKRKVPATTFHYSPENEEEFIALENAASGVIESAGIRLYLHEKLRQDINSGFIIEEPEAHLHPLLQVNLCGLLYQLSQKLPGIIITTHSDYFTQKINNIILEEKLKEIKKQKVSEEKIETKISVVFLKENDLGEIIAEEVEIDEYGLQPNTFLDVIDELANESTQLITEIENKRE